MEIEITFIGWHKVQLDFVIVNHNSGRFLKQCLDALHKYDGTSPDHTITVYDNGSTDDSLRIVREYFPNVRCIGTRTNLGFARAVNRAVAETHADYIVLINPDAIIFPHTIERMHAFMETRARCGIIGGEILNPRGFLQHTCRRFPTYFNILFGRRSLARRFFPSNPFSCRYLYCNLDYTQPQKVDFVEGSLMMIRRKALEDVGYFDEGFFLYLEDADLCYRMAQRGWETWWVPQTYAIHFRGENFRSDNIRPAMHHSRGFYRFFTKHYNPSALVQMLLHVFLGLRLVYVISTESMKELFHDVRFVPRN